MTLFYRVVATLHDADNMLAIALYREMQAAEKNYMATRNRPLLQSAINVGNQLSRRVWASASSMPGSGSRLRITWSAMTRSQYRLAISTRKSAACPKEFDLQDQAVNPISEELISLAKAEVERAQAKLERTSQWTTIVIFSVVAGALALAAFIVRLLHVSFTRNVVKLTKAVGELQSGKVATQGGHRQRR